MLISIFVLALGLGNSPEAAAQVANDEAQVTSEQQQVAAAESAEAPAQAPAGSDAPAEAKKPPTPAHTGLHALGSNLIGDVKHLPSAENGYLLLVGGALAAASHPVDDTFNVRLRSHYDLVNTTFAPAKYLGNTPEQVAMSLGTYAYGRIFDQPKVSHLGMDLLRAQIITEMLVQPVKFATHRERPDGTNSQSFPSGHAAATFAAATVIERHLGWRRSLLGYGIATYVAASRLHDNRHYLSDVAFGAAVGTIAGRTVTQHGASNWTVIPVDVPGGVAVLALRTGW
jgi:hypothetical protein